MITLYIKGTRGSGKTTALKRIADELGPVYPLTRALGGFSLGDYNGEKILIVDEPHWTDRQFREMFIDGDRLICHRKGHDPKIWDLPQLLIIAENAP